MRLSDGNAGGLQDSIRRRALLCWNGSWDFPIFHKIDLKNTDPHLWFCPHWVRGFTVPTIFADIAADILVGHPTSFYTTHHKDANASGRVACENWIIEFHSCNRLQPSPSPKPPKQGCEASWGRMVLLEESPLSHARAQNRSFTTLPQGKLIQSLWCLSLNKIPQLIFPATCLLFYNVLLIDN